MVFKCSPSIVVDQLETNWPMASLILFCFDKAFLIVIQCSQKCPKYRPTQSNYSPLQIMLMYNNLILIQYQTSILPLILQQRLHALSFSTCWTFCGIQIFTIDFIELLKIVVSKLLTIQILIADLIQIVQFQLIFQWRKWFQIFLQRWSSINGRTHNNGCCFLLSPCKTIHF